MPSKEFPLGLLQMCTKVTNEPPAGLKPGLLRSYTISVDQDRLERVETVQWRQLLFDLCFMHSIVQERRKFGPLGWCIPYEYNTGDLEACMKFLEKHLYNGPISWPTFQYMVHEAQYGGRITDSVDRRLFGYYAEKFLKPNSCEPDFTFNPAVPVQPIPKDFVYKIPVSENIDDFRNYLQTFPEIDSPELFGLHPNADLTFRVKQAGALLTQMSETQPKGGGGSSAVSPSDIVSAKAAEILERMPEDYLPDEYKAKIQKLGGLTIPLNIFLFQEVERLQAVIKKVRFMLEQLILAIKGEVVMSTDLAAALTAMYEANVPNTWVFTVAGDEFSWILPTLGLWVTSLMARDDQNRTWLDHGRPNSFWMTGFFNPQGMLTAMKQEVTRKHKKEQWALDDVVYHSEVTNMKAKENVRGQPEEGVYVHGLFLDGAAWSNHDGILEEQAPKKLFSGLPVLYVSANIKDAQAKVNKQLYGPQGPYEAPIYKYPARTDRFFITFANLKCTPDKNPLFWGLRGTALLENTD
jgi:dynein heavy chain